MQKKQLEQLLNSQKEAFRIAVPNLEKRLKSLKKLSELISQYKEELIEAVSRDFGYRVPEETLILEILPLQDQIRHTIQHLKDWMKPKKVSRS